MQRSLSALLTAILAIPVVGYLTHAQLRAESQSASVPQLQIRVQSPNSSDPDHKYTLNLSPDFALQHLALTSEQQAQIQSLQDHAQLELAALNTQLSIEQDTLERLIASKDTAAADLREQHQVLQALQQAIADNRFEILLAIRAVLTPEQLTLLSIQVERSLAQVNQTSTAEIRPN